jgi:hypothetical protein
MISIKANVATLWSYEFVTRLLDFIWEGNISEEFPHLKEASFGAAFASEKALVEDDNIKIL